MGMKIIPLIAAGSGRSACLASGARGIVMGTRILASKEAAIAKGCQGDVLGTTDGRRTTFRTSAYDTLCGIEWPFPYKKVMMEWQGHGICCKRCGLGERKTIREKLNQ